MFARQSLAPPCLQPAAFPHAGVLTIRLVMCGNAAVAMTNLAMIAGVAVRMTKQPKTAAINRNECRMTAMGGSRANRMIWQRTINGDEDVVAVAVVMTPPAMTVADEVAAATIRAEFRVAGRPWKDSYFPGPFDTKG